MPRPRDGGLLWCHAPEMMEDFCGAIWGSADAMAAFGIAPYSLYSALFSYLTLCNLVHYKVNRERFRTQLQPQGMKASRRCFGYFYFTFFSVVNLIL